MDNETINVTAVKVTNYKVYVPGGYQLVSGWTVANDSGQFYSTDGETPSVFRGGKKAAKLVEASGLLPGATFIQ